MVLGAHPEGVTVRLNVQPRASRSRIRGVADGAVRLAVAAPPVDGAANKAVVQFLSKQLRVRKRDITLIAGERSRNKTVLIRGLTADQVAERLGLPAAPPDKKCDD